MFNGVPRAVPPIHSSKKHTSSSPVSFPPFDAYNPSHHLLPLPPPPPNLLDPLHHKDEQHKQEENSMNLDTNARKGQLGEHELELLDSWTNDEMIALLRIRSSMETWFPDLTWERVSRKLAEVGFKTSADKCKEKFEEETRFFNNNIHYTKNDNYRFVSELEQLYQQQEANQIPEDEAGSQWSKQLLEKPAQEQHRKMDHALEEGSGYNAASLTEQYEESVKAVEKSKYRKRKRHDKLEMLKGFCENIVNKMMAQQEEMQKKLLEDMLKRDQEKFAREEAWKKQEIDRMNRELEMMAKEQAIAGDRQAAIMEFLKKFSDQCHHIKTVSNGSDPNSLTSSSLNSQNPNPSCNYIEKNIPEPPPISTTVVLNYEDTTDENPHSSSVFPSSSNGALVPHNPNSLITQYNPSPAQSVSTHKTCSNNSISTEKDEVGRRWPREEVLALINLRCSLNNNSNNEEKDGGSRIPLWERISQGMWELGYKRSAKRCKEKWENINKYFRKTKDVSKKRSLDSRTCPYFHQLTTLYSQGKLMNSESHENLENRSPHTSHQLDSHASGDDKTLIQQLPPPPSASDYIPL